MSVSPIRSQIVRAAAWWLPVLGVFAAVLLTAPRPSVAGPEASVPRGPAYDEQGRLLLPPDYRRWTLVGTSLGLSYSEGAPSAARRDEMFHEVLMEPTAYDHFVATGTFREGTMLVLVLHGTGEQVPPQRRGLFAAEVHGVEMAVKDSSRFEGSWAYFGFGGMDEIRSAAVAAPRERCQACHAEHAALDNVFVQFYPVLVEAAPEGLLADGARDR